MTREEFYAICKEISGIGVITNKKYDEIGECICGNSRNAKPGDKYIYVSWLSGGVRGGSCWDTGPADYHPVEPEEKPNFSALEEILETIFPDISLKKYKEFLALVKTGSYYRNEYYGNSSYYSIEYVLLDELYDRINVVMKARGENK